MLTFSLSKPVLPVSFKKNNNLCRDIYFTHATNENVLSSFLEKFLPIKLTTILYLMLWL